MDYMLTKLFDEPASGKSKQRIRLLRPVDRLKNSVFTLTVRPSQANVTSHKASRSSSDNKTPVKLVG